MPTMFNSFMNSQNLDVQADAQVTNGAPLRYNWDNGASAQGVNAREVLPTGDYDTVIVTEAIPLDTHLQYSDTEGYAARYFELAQSANPDTRFYVYETWHYIGTDTQAWRAQIAEDLPKWQGIVDHVNDTAAPGAPEASIIPAGQAMARLHDRIEAGDVPGTTSIRDLFSDDIHLNDTGNWFVAALQASAVTGVDPATLPLETTNIWGAPYGGPDAALAQVMAEVIDDTLEQFQLQGTVPPADGGEVFPPMEEPEDTPADNTPDSGALYGGSGNDVLYRSAGDDTLYGGRGDDTLYGGSGNDALMGGAGNDLLVGDGGDDTLMAEDGADTVSGGDGDDVFVLSAVPGSVLITDFGANGAQDLIDLSALDGYGSFADVTAVASASGSETLLTFAVPDGVLRVTIRSEDPLTRDDFVLSAARSEPDQAAAPAPPVDSSDATGLTFSIAGADRHHFDIDPVTGDLSNMSWFEPSFDQIWDSNGDRVYEVERIASDANGQEIGRTFFELETRPDGVVWREVGHQGEDVDPDNATTPVDPADAGTGSTASDAAGPSGPNDAASTFFLEGPDAYHFVVDPDSGALDNAAWFDPSYDRVWDTDGDRIYEVERVGANENGDEVSRTFFEFETTANGPVWREVAGEAREADPIGPIDDGRTFFLEGPDAYHFVIDPESGALDNVSWFDPSYDRVWDNNGDRIYEVERFALAQDGTEIGREALEMETTADGVVWRVVSPGDEELSGTQIMSALALPPVQEDDLPAEPEESTEDAILPM